MLTDSQRRYYEYYKGRTGWFDTNLFDLIKAADEVNLERIRKGFPEEVDAYMNDKKGFITLYDIKIELARERVVLYKKEDEQ